MHRDTFPTPSPPPHPFAHNLFIDTVSHCVAIPVDCHCMFGSVRKYSMQNGKKWDQISVHLYSVVVVYSSRGPSATVLCILLHSVGNPACDHHPSTHAVIILFHLSLVLYFLSNTCRGGGISLPLSVKGWVEIVHLINTRRIIGMEVNQSECDETT